MGKHVKNKVFDSFDAAVKDISDGAAIMMNSFAGAGGIAQGLIRALRDRGVRNLTIICCSTGVGSSLQQKYNLKPFITPNILVENKQVRKLIGVWAQALGSTAQRGVEEINPVGQAIRNGEIEWEPYSIGVLSECVRAGAVGHGGFYSPVGVGTILERNRTKTVIDGKEYLLYPPIKADYAFVRAWKADKKGNLIYRGTSRGLNTLFAMATKVTIVETDHIVDVGDIDPEHVVTPGVFVDRIVEIPGQEGASI